MPKYQDDDGIVHELEHPFYDRCACKEPTWNMLEVKPSTTVTCLGCLVPLLRTKTIAERIATEPARTGDTR